MNPSVIVGAVVAVVFIACGAAIAAVYSMNPGAIVGLITAIVAPTVPALLALLKADKAQQQTNGSLDKRIQENLHIALDEREENESGN